MLNIYRSVLGSTSNLCPCSSNHSAFLFVIASSESLILISPSVKASEIFSRFFSPFPCRNNVWMTFWQTSVATSSSNIDVVRNFTAVFLFEYKCWRKSMGSSPSQRMFVPFVGNFSTCSRILNIARCRVKRFLYSGCLAIASSTSFICLWIGGLDKPLTSGLKNTVVFKRTFCFLLAFFLPKKLI